jgi:hypothetical protein
MGMPPSKRGVGGAVVQGDARLPAVLCKRKHEDRPLAQRAMSNRLDQLDEGVVQLDKIPPF